MKPEELSQIRRFVDRGIWKHSAHMVRDRWGDIDMRHFDNIKRVSELIADAKSEAYALKTEAESVERVMSNMDMILHLRMQKRTENENGHDSGQKI